VESNGRRIVSTQTLIGKFLIAILASAHPFGSATKRRRDESWSGDEFEAWLGTTGWISLLICESLSRD
jgi:hypothetical protein